MEGRKVKLKGKVIEEGSMNEQTGCYMIRTDDRSVKVISEGKQAVKDYLFIRMNQEMEIDGTEKDNRVYAKKSWITIKRK